MQCPACAHDNLPGTDECESCGTSLYQEDLPPALAKEEIEHSLAEDRIEVLGPAAPITLDEKTSVSDAIASMNENRIGCLLVTDAAGLHRVAGAGCQHRGLVEDHRDIIAGVGGGRDVQRGDRDRVRHAHQTGLVGDDLLRTPAPHYPHPTSRDLAALCVQRSENARTGPGPRDGLPTPAADSPWTFNGKQASSPEQEFFQRRATR